jgi:hypothetical protein
MSSLSRSTVAKAPLAAAAASRRGERVRLGLRGLGLPPLLLLVPRGVLRGSTPPASASSRSTARRSV